MYLALLQPGDTVLGLRLDQGGHLTHGSPVNASGKLYNFVSYGVTPSDERIDLDQVRDLASRPPKIIVTGATARDAALEHRPKIIVTGATAYPRIIDPKPFRAIADEVGALFMFDAAHIAGLIAGGQHPNPMDHGADIMTLTTHKTLRGPRGGAILCTAELAEVIDKSVFPGLQGGPLDHVDRRQGARLRRGGHARVQGLRRPDRAQRRGPRRGARRPRASASCRAAPTTTSCSSTCAPSTPTSPARRPGWRSTRPASASTRTPCPTTPARRTSRRGLRIGTPPSPPRAWARAEMATIAELIHRTLVGREDDGRAGRRQATTSLALCSKFTPVPDGHLSALGAGLPRGLPRPSSAAAALVTLLVDAAVPAARRSASAPSQAPDERRVHTRPTAARSAAPPSSLGFLAGDGRRLAAPTRSTRCSPRSTVPLGVVLGRARDLRRRAARRPPRGVAAGQDRRHRARRQRPVDLRRQHPLLPHPVRRPRRRCRPTCRRCSPCCGWSAWPTAINFIDGLDGLAAGIVAIAAGALLLYCERLLERRRHRRRTTPAR